MESLDFDSFQMFLVIELMENLLERNFEPSDEDFVRLSGTVRSIYQLYLEKDSEPSAAVGKPGPVKKGPVVSLRGRIVALRPLEPSDYRQLFSLVSSEETAWRWRYAGALPSYEDWLQSLNNGVLTQLVVTNRANQVVGLVVAYNANLSNGTCYVAAMVASEMVGSGGGIEAVILFLRYVFTTWSVVKAYLEVPEFNVDQFQSSIDRVCISEGRLRDHLVYGGKCWDQLILSISREGFANRWMSEGDASTADGLLR